MKRDKHVGVKIVYREQEVNAVNRMLYLPRKGFLASFIITVFDDKYVYHQWLFL